MPWSLHVLEKDLHAFVDSYMQGSQLNAKIIWYMQISCVYNCIYIQYINTLTHTLYRSAECLSIDCPSQLGPNSLATKSNKPNISKHHRLRPFFIIDKIKAWPITSNPIFHSVKSLSIFPFPLYFFPCLSVKTPVYFPKCLHLKTTSDCNCFFRHKHSQAASIKPITASAEIQATVGGPEKTWIFRPHKLTNSRLWRSTFFQNRINLQTIRLTKHQKNNRSAHLL